MPDITKASNLINFTPTRSLDEILISVIDNQKSKR